MKSPGCKKSNAARGLAGLILMCTGGLGLACTVPVFRYALDRWESDAFRLVVPASWMTDREKLKLLVPLRGNGEANVTVEESPDPAMTTAKLLFPHDGTALWEGELQPASLSELLDSPLRQDLLRRLLAGDSVVWVVATAAEQKGEVERIAARLRFLEQVAVLPTQDPNDPDSKLGPGPPLALRFSVLPLSLDDPAEQILAALLAGPEHADFVVNGTPFTAAVFGRGRVLGAWALDEIDDVGIEDASLFLTGRCSCRVKNENPGWDLLMKVDWERSLEEVDALEPSPELGEATTFPVTDTVVMSPAVASTTPSSPQPAWLRAAGIVGVLVLLVAGWRLWCIR